MRIKQKKFNYSVYVPVLLILLSLTIMVSSTFAYFTNTLNAGGNTQTFGKVELSADTAQGISGSVMDAIPGMPLIDDAVSFSLSSTSKPVYVRAKISYSGDASLSDYLTALRSATNYGFTSTANYHWTEKSGNYVYLVDNNDELLRVTDTTSYTLTSSFSLPTDLEQLEGNAQYMAQIQFHIEFQALQADNLGTSTENDIKALFDELFPESAAEAYTQAVTPEEPAQVGNATLVGAESSPSSSSNFLGVDGLTRSSIQSITFDGASEASVSPSIVGAAYISGAPVGYTISGDVSAAQDGSIMLYAVPNSTKFDVTICSNDVIKLPANSSSLFAYLINCVGLDLTNVDTSAITNMIDMFRQSGGLTSFTIPSGVATIGSGAFQGCANLTSITIPSSVTIISSSVFSGCSNLTNVYYTGTSDQYDVITKMNGNDALASATVYYNYTNHTVNIISDARGVTYTFLSGETCISLTETQLTGKGRLRISYSLAGASQNDLEEQDRGDNSIIIGSTLHGTEYLESINGERTGYIDIEMDADKTIYVETYYDNPESPVIIPPINPLDPNEEDASFDWQEMTQAEFEALDPNSIDAPEYVYVTDTDEYYQLVDSLDGDFCYELYEEAPL